MGVDKIPTISGVPNQFSRDKRNRLPNNHEIPEEIQRPSVVEAVIPTSEEVEDEEKRKGIGNIIDKKA